MQTLENEGLRWKNMSIFNNLKPEDREDLVFLLKGSNGLPERVVEEDLPQWLREEGMTGLFFRFPDRSDYLPNSFIISAAPRELRINIIANLRRLFECDGVELLFDSLPAWSHEMDRKYAAYKLTK